MAVATGPVSTRLLFTGKLHPKAGSAFPKQSFGNQNRYCALRRVIGSVAGRFSSYYNEGQDVVFCHTKFQRQLHVFRVWSSFTRLIFLNAR